MTIHKKIIRPGQMPYSGDLRHETWRRVFAIVRGTEVEMVIVDIFVMALTEPEGVGGLWNQRGFGTFWFA